MKSIMLIGTLFHNCLLATNDNVAAMQ